MIYMYTHIYMHTCTQTKIHATGTVFLLRHKSAACRARAEKRHMSTYACMFQCACMCVCVCQESNHAATNAYS